MCDIIWWMSAPEGVALQRPRLIAFNAHAVEVPLAIVHHHAIDVFIAIGFALATKRRIRIVEVLVDALYAPHLIAGSRLQHQREESGVSLDTAIPHNVGGPLQQQQCTSS